MRIRETKEVSREISFEKAAVYYISDYRTGSMLYGDMAAISKQDGHVGDSLILLNGKPVAKFRVSEEREMTPMEGIAWHCIEAAKLRELLPFPMDKQSQFSETDCEEIMEGKEMIV